MLEHFHHYLESLLGILTVVGAVSPWAYRWIRNIDLMAKFVRHAHDKELPHIHEALEEIAPKVNLHYVRPPEEIGINGK